MFKSIIPTLRDQKKMKDNQKEQKTTKLKIKKKQMINEKVGFIYKYQ